MANVIKIKYVGPATSDVRNAPNQIPAIFEPTNSYVDTDPYVLGVEGEYGSEPKS